MTRKKKGKEEEVDEKKIFPIYKEICCLLKEHDLTNEECEQVIGTVMMALYLGLEFPPYYVKEFCDKFYQSYCMSYGAKTTHGKL